MSKLLKNVIIGVASGAAAAYFLSTEKGKEFQKKAAKAYEAYKENPAEYHQKAKDKATEYTDLAVDTFNDYRQKFESGELTTDEFLDTVKEKGKAAADFASAARRASALAFASSMDLSTAFLRVLPSHQPPITRIAAITTTATIAIITFVSMTPA